MVRGRRNRSLRIRKEAIMSRKRIGQAVGLAGMVLLVGSAWWSFGAQDDRAPAQGQKRPRNGVSAAPPAREPAPVASAKARDRGATPSVQDALYQPCDLPFGRET